MSPASANSNEATQRFPRVSGDEPVADFNRQIKSAFPPCEWG